MSVGFKFLISYYMISPMNRNFSSLILLVAICALSTTCKADTVDNYQIYIGKTLKLAESEFHVPEQKFSFLKLDTSNYTDTIHINYSHCTAGASSRQIKLTDSAGNTVKVWEFGDKYEQPLMSIRIGDILSHPAIISNGSYKLYYQDREYQGWRLLTYLVIGETGFKKASAGSSFFGPGNTYLMYGLGVFNILCLTYLFVRRRKAYRRAFISA